MSSDSGRGESVWKVTEEDLVKKRKAVEQLEDKCREKRRGWAEWEEQRKKEDDQTAKLK